MEFEPDFSADSFLPFAVEDRYKPKRVVRFKSVNKQCSQFNRSFQGTTGTEETNSIPWKKTANYSCGVIGLHEEIKDFFETMSPTEQETEIRLQAIEHVTRIIHSLWPQAKVEIFGSFRTGLYLPSSDIDMVVLGEWQKLPLSTLSEALIRNGVDKNDIDIIPSANVPIVKLHHTPTKVRIDISFNMQNGVKAAKMIKNVMKEYPALPKLLLILKQFLLQRGLNEVYSGGMSSYCLTLLLISFLQGNHKPKSRPSKNLGTLLIEFFELYGINFNYVKVSIHVQDGGNYQPKYRGGLSLSVEDPLLEGNDVAKGTFLIHQLKMSFQNAFNVLHKAVNDSAAMQRPYYSYLGLIIKVDEEILKKRQWMAENYASILQSISSSHMPFFQQEKPSTNVENKAKKKKIK